MGTEVWIPCPDCEGSGWLPRVSGDAQCQRCGGSGRCKHQVGEKVGKCSRCSILTNRECICGRLLCLACTRREGHCGCEIDEVKKVKK